MKTLFLHIGHYKTGTSAIQKFCSDHARALAQIGLYYPAVARPQNNNTNHGQLSLSLAQAHGFQPPPWYVERRSPDEVFSEFREDVEKSGHDRILISSEEFFQLGLRENPLAAIADLRERLTGFDVRIILYIREPMSLLRSWFNQRNKGPRGTRTFPVFFQNLNPDFLSQLAPYKCFVEIFGSRNILVRSYVHRGMAHIADFLGALGQTSFPDLEMTDNDILVNTAVPIERVEAKRIEKRQERDLDTVTLSRISSLEGLLDKTAQINRAFSEIARKSNIPLTSALSLTNVFRHHRALITPLVAAGEANDKEAAILRDIAFEAETHDLELAAELMRTARLIRPRGAIIRRKLEEYERLLAEENARRTG